MEAKEIEKLRDMELHEVRRVADCLYMRVVGGWIYTMMRLDCNQMTSVFVPDSEVV